VHIGMSSRIFLDRMTNTLRVTFKIEGGMFEFWNKPSQIKLHGFSTLLRFSRLPLL